METCGNVRVTGTGNLRTRLHSLNLEVEGMFHGNVRIVDKVTLKGGARFEGDVSARRLVVFSGARLKGFYRIEP